MRSAAGRLLRPTNLPNALYSIPVNLHQAAIITCPTHIRPDVREIKQEVANTKISDTHVNHAWPAHREQDAIGEIGILRDNRQIIIGCVFPNLSVGPSSADVVYEFIIGTGPEREPSR